MDKTIKELVNNCCINEISYEKKLPLLLNKFGKSDIIELYIHYHRVDIKNTVDTIKIIIKAKKNDSLSKYLALNLLNECLKKGTKSMWDYTAQKISSRLKIFASFRKNEQIPDKGKEIFGTKCNQIYSLKFYNNLHQYLREWAAHEIGKTTTLCKIYYELVKERVIIQQPSHPLSVPNNNFRNSSKENTKKAATTKSGMSSTRGFSMNESKSNTIQNVKGLIENVNECFNGSSELDEEIKKEFIKQIAEQKELLSKEIQRLVNANKEMEMMEAINYSDVLDELIKKINRKPISIPFKDIPKKDGINKIENKKKEEPKNIVGTLIY